MCSGERSKHRPMKDKPYSSQKNGSFVRKSEKGRRIEVVRKDEGFVGCVYAWFIVSVCV